MTDKNESEAYGTKINKSFMMIPRVFFKDARYSGITPHAMILYGMMRDRSLMSEKRNEYIDEKGVYIIFKRDDICSILNCGHDKAEKIIKELESYRLISVKHQGRNKPNKYYVENLLPDIRASSVLTAGKPPPDVEKSDAQDVGKQDGNYIDYSYKDTIYTDSNHSICIYDPNDVETYIKEKIDYDFLIHRDLTTQDILSELISIMVDTICCLTPTVKIGKEEYPRNLVRSRFLNYDTRNMEYVLDMLQSNTSIINNMHSYLLKVLFTAPTTLKNYYNAAVRHDFGY